MSATSTRRPSTSTDEYGTPPSAGRIGGIDPPLSHIPRRSPPIEAVDEL
jgi:hypothetical protein